MYNLKEACQHAGTIVKPFEHRQNLTLRPNYPLVHYKLTSALIIPSLSPPEMPQDTLYFNFSSSPTVTIGSGGPKVAPTFEYGFNSET